MRERERERESSASTRLQSHYFKVVAIVSRVLSLFLANDRAAHERRSRSLSRPLPASDASSSFASGFPTP